MRYMYVSFFNLFFCCIFARNITLIVIMKKITEIIFVVFTLMGCSPTMTKEQIEIDKHLKDSIALADGNKVLGNIRFGISQDDFKEQSDIFFDEQHDSIYGLYIQDKIGLFTPDDRLYKVKFISTITAEDKPEKLPFDDFLHKKFGEPTGTKTWIVGDRRIIIRNESLSMSLHYQTRLAYRERLANPFKKEEPYDPEKAFKQYNFYVMAISSDSLTQINNRLKVENTLKMKQDDKNDGKRRKEQLEEQLENL